MKTNILTRIALIGAVCFVSCQKDKPTAETFNREGMLKLGKQLDNPYSVETMKEAWNNIQQNNSSYRMMGAGITTTHLYLKFKPQNEEELSLLQEDSTLTLYTHPLDYEILGDGDYYHDPEIPDSLPTYQYCAVPADKVLPAGVSHEVLAKLFIPDEDPDDEGKRFASGETTDALVDEALRITDNLEPDEDQGNQRRRRKWRPQGSVQVYHSFSENKNRNSRYIPVQGAVVRARRWFTTRKGTTDADGKFSCNGRFRRAANYSIRWERYHFSIRSGTLGQAVYNGPKKRGGWNLKLGRQGSNFVKDKQQYYALIFQAAHFYYYGDRMGLTSPSRNSWWKKQLKIAARAKNGSSSHVHQRTLYWGADISLQKYGNYSDLVFATTIHELAHGAHRELHKNNYNHLVSEGYVKPCVSHWDCMESNADISSKAKNKRRLLETWAKTVEIALTRNWYINHCNISNYVFERANYQSVEIEDKPYYTSAGYDLIDDEDQSETFTYLNTPNDRVKGYSILQLEQALKHARSWEEWRDNIKEDYDNPTEKYVDELFANWSDD